MSPTQYKVSSAYTVKQGDDNALMELLETHGAVTVNFFVDDKLPLYSSGIYAVNPDICSRNPPSIKLIVNLKIIIS